VKKPTAQIVPAVLPLVKNHHSDAKVIIRFVPPNNPKVRTGDSTESYFMVFRVQNLPTLGLRSLHSSCFGTRIWTAHLYLGEAC